MRNSYLKGETLAGQICKRPKTKSHRLAAGMDLSMRKELIKISEYQRRRWGENGTPLCSQAIRNYIRNGKLPGEQIGSLWYVDWNALNIADGNDLVAMVLKGVA